jgi:hypothetical protein
MYVIKLPNGRLLVPESALDSGGGVIGDAYVEIGPEDSEYARLAAQAQSEQEMAQRRRRWQDGDEALRREFEAFRAGRAGRTSPPEPQGPSAGGG